MFLNYIKFLKKDRYSYVLHIISDTTIIILLKINNMSKELTKRKTLLKNVRITVKNILFVIGIPKELTFISEEDLSTFDYFGKYGKVIKITINEKPYQIKNNTEIYSIHINYLNERDCSIALLSLSDKIVKGNKLKASYGTTKYCKNFLEDKICINKECLYYHKFDVSNEMSKEDIINNKEILYITQVKLAIKHSEVLIPSKIDEIFNISYIKSNPIVELPDKSTLFENAYLQVELRKPENDYIFKYINNKYSQINTLNSISNLSTFDSKQESKNSISRLVLNLNNEDTEENYIPELVNIIINKTKSSFSAYPNDILLEISDYLSISLPELFLFINSYSKLRFHISTNLYSTYNKQSIDKDWLYFIIMNKKI